MAQDGTGRRRCPHAPRARSASAGLHRRAAATPAQIAAWDGLEQIAAAYRNLRGAQAKLVRQRLGDEARRLPDLSGEFSDIVDVWPDHDIADTRDAEPPPWGEQLPHGTSAGADFIAWAAETPPGTVWVPTCAELKSAAEEALQKTAVRVRVRAGGDKPAEAGRELVNVKRAAESLCAINEAATGTHWLT